MIEQHWKLAMERAHSFATTTGLPLEELQDAAKDLLVTATQKYNIDKGVKFSTFAHTCITNGLIDLAQKERPVHLVESTEEPGVSGERTLSPDKYEAALTSDKYRPDHQMAMVMMIANLSEPSRKVISLIMNRSFCRRAKVKSDDVPKIIRKNLREFLINRWGWKDYQVSLVFREIRTALKNL